VANVGGRIMSYHLHNPLYWAHNTIEETNYHADDGSNYLGLFSYRLKIKQRLWGK
jgi:hypothetical protein